MPVEVIPGPSACVTALVSSGIPCEHFFFEGFLGRKHGDRVRRLQRLAVVPGALIFYESPHRIVATLEAVADPDEALREDIRAALEEGEPASAVAKRLSQKYSRRKRDVYAMVLDMQ